LLLLGVLPVAQRRRAPRDPAPRGPAPRGPAPRDPRPQHTEHLQGPSGI